MVTRLTVLALAVAFAVTTSAVSASRPVAAGSPNPGDFDCHNEATAYDSLLLVSYLAGDELAHPGCDDIGDKVVANGLIAFEHGRNLATIGPEGGDQRDIVTESTYAVYPAWSHDGKHVVFSSGRSGPHDQLFIADADGSNVTPLTTSSVDDATAQWSPDDTQIIFDSYNGNDNDIFMVNANGTNRHAILTGPHDDYYPDWSPDGTRIVFMSDRAGNSGIDIYTMTPTGANIQLLYDDDYYKGSPHYSPDGAKIVFDTVNDNADIAVIPASGGSPNYLTDNAARDSDPNWSPDGTSILFDSARDDPDPENCDPCVQHIYRMDADGSHEAKLTQDGNDNDDAAQQPLVSTFGDLNCDGVVTTDDLLVSLAHAASIDVDLPAGCPPLT